MAKIYNNVTEFIGRTPLMEVTNIEKSQELKAKLLVKLEYLNPAGSTKDRAAKFIIADAEAKGLLKPGSTIIEPTSGNTGIGLASICAYKGYKLILTMPDTMSIERINILKAYGAEIILTPGAQGMAGSVAKAEELQKEILLDFYYGNFHGGKSTKYGKFMTFLGGSWGCRNEKSRACNTYHFYDKLSNRLRNEYLSKTEKGCWEYGTDEYNKYCERSSKLRKRQDRELKRYLYKEFCEFSDTCKPTIVRIWEQNWQTKEWHGTNSYLHQYSRSRKYANLTNFEGATKFTSKLRLEKMKKIAEHNGYRAEFIEV